MTFTPDIPWIQRVSAIMPDPTLVDGRPVDWNPTSIIRQDWGVLQLVVNGRDLSRPRAKLFLPLTDTHAEPFGDADASFAFPGISEFDRPSDFGIERFVLVKLRRRLPDGSYRVLYEGFVASVEPDTGNGLTIHCMGPLYRADLLKLPPAMYVESKDCGTLIAEAINRKRRLYSLNIGQFPHRRTGVTGTSNTQFTELVTGAIQNWLSTMTTRDGSQWTVMLRRPRQPHMRKKDMHTVSYTVCYGQPGVDVQLSRDHTQAVTGVYGDGSAGHKQWMGAKFPNLTDGPTPAYPLSGGATFHPGDSHTGFGPFAAYLRRGQYGSIVSDDTYDPADKNNVRQFQHRAGVTVDGIVGAQSWEAAFAPGRNQGSVRGAYVDTIWERSATRRYKTNAQGAITGANPDFDPTVPRIEDYVPFGDHTPKNLGRRAAHQMVRRTHKAPLTGTIILTADPEECSRFHMRAGHNIRIKHYRGGTAQVRIVQRDRDWQTGTVTLTVDEAGRDRLTVAAIHQRNRDVSDLTRRQRFGRTRSHTFNDFGAWLEEDGAGEIPLMSQQGGFWNVQLIPAAPQGQIANIALAIGSGLTEHHLKLIADDNPPTSIPGAGHGVMALFERPVTARQLSDMPGMSTPTSNMTGDENPWDHNHHDLRHQFGLIFAAGGPDNQIGFYPDQDPGDGSTTNLSGLFFDGGGVAFGPTGHFWLWLAIWTPMSTKVGGKLFPAAPS